LKPDRTFVIINNENSNCKRKGRNRKNNPVNKSGWLFCEVILADLDVEEPNSGLFIKGETVHNENKYKMIPEWEQDKCSLCGLCQEVCNFHAVIQLVDQILVFPELCHSSAYDSEEDGRVESF